MEIKNKALELYSVFDRIEQNQILTAIDKQLLKEKIKEIYNLIPKDKQSYCIKSWQRLKSIKSEDLTYNNYLPILTDAKYDIMDATGVRVPLSKPLLDFIDKIDRIKGKKSAIIDYLKQENNND